MERSAASPDASIIAALRVQWNLRDSTKQKNHRSVGKQVHIRGQGAVQKEQLK